jgi:hypothetical protein
MTLVPAMPHVVDALILSHSAEHITESSHCSVGASARLDALTRRYAADHFVFLLRVSAIVSPEPVPEGIRSESRFLRRAGLSAMRACSAVNGA